MYWAIVACSTYFTYKILFYLKVYRRIENLDLVESRSEKNEILVDLNLEDCITVHSQKRTLPTQTPNVVHNPFTSQSNYIYTE